MYDHKRNWNMYNQQLVDRGRPSTYLKSAICNHSSDLSKMNQNKVGKPYRYTTLEVIAAFAIKSVFKIGYREAAGNIADYAESNNLQLEPNFRSIHWRISKMQKEGIKLLIYPKGKGCLEVIIDASGIKSVNDGEYRSTKYDKIKVWEKIHIAIDRETRRIINIIVTENDVGDITEFIPLLKPIEERNRVTTVITDGAYGSENNFKHCDDKAISTLIPVHVNSINGKHKKRRIEEQLGLDCKRGSTRLNRHITEEMKQKNQDMWKKKSGYHRRSMVETVFSVFKGTFGEYTFSKRKDMKEKELLLKTVVYNTFLT